VDSAGGAWWKYYDVTVTVRDSGQPFASSSASFAISVIEENSVPNLTQIRNQLLNEGARLSLTATANDADSPKQDLTYSLGTDAPIGVTIDPVTGLLEWTLPEVDADTTMQIPYVVTDNGSPSRSVEKSFSVTILDTSAAPVVSIAYPALPYEENSGNLPIFSDVQVFDLDSPDFDGGELIVEISGGLGENDYLGLGAGVQMLDGQLFIGSTNIGDYTMTSSRLRVELSVGATAERIETLLKNVMLSNDSDNPLVGQRIIRVTLDDGDRGISSPQELAVNVFEVNDPPELGPIVFSGLQNHSLAIPFDHLTERATDPEGDLPVIAEILSTAGDAVSFRGGSVALSATTLSLVYSPPTAFTGMDEIQIQLTDSRGGRRIETIVVEVSEVDNYALPKMLPAAAPFGTISFEADLFPLTTYELWYSPTLANWTKLSSVQPDADGAVRIEQALVEDSGFFQLRLPDSGGTIIVHPE